MGNQIKHMLVTLIILKIDSLNITIILGLKSTKGHKWKLIYKKKFVSKTLAMSYEYFLKKI